MGVALMKLKLNLSCQVGFWAIVRLRLQHWIKISDLTLSSSGGAGELQGNSFGVFQYSHKFTERHVREGEKGPVYQQRHNGDGDGDLMYRFKVLIIVWIIHWILENPRS